MDPGGFECYGKFSKINNAVGCGEIHQDAGGNNSYSRESLRMRPDATRFLPYKDVIQVELKSTQPNHVFCPMVPLKELGPTEPKGMAPIHRILAIYGRILRFLRHLSVPFTQIS